MNVFVQIFQSVIEGIFSITNDYCDSVCKRTVCVCHTGRGGALLSYFRAVPGCHTDSRVYGYDTKEKITRDIIKQNKKFKRRSNVLSVQKR